MKKFFLERNIFCSRAAFKSSFFAILMVMTFGYDIVLGIGLF